MPSIGTPIQYTDTAMKIHPGLISGVDSNGTVLSVLWWDATGRNGNTDGLVYDQTQQTPNSWTEITS